MKDHRITVFLPEGRGEAVEACFLSIRELKVPDGYELQVARWRDMGENYAEAARQLMAESSAKYKIFLDPRVSFIVEDALCVMLSIFRKNPEIGALGICGSRWFSTREQGLKPVGGFFALDEEGTPRKYQWDVGGSFRDDYEYVHHLNGMMLATQYDLPVAETGARSWMGENLLRSFDYASFGYQLAVPRQPVPWCLFADKKPGWFDGVPMGCFQGLYYGGIFGGCGTGSRIGKITITAPERVHIGVQVTIENQVRLDAAEGHIQIGNFVSIGEGAEIHAPRGGLVIEDGVEIGPETIIDGAAHIGAGAVIASRACVKGDVPSYCHLRGNPAGIISYFDEEKYAWRSVFQEPRGEAHPVLTVAIPTFNRARYLVKSLRSLCVQAGNNPFVEIFVSDNASTDDTPMVTDFYANRYDNVRVCRQKENIGGAKNFDYLRRHAKGKYVVTIGDDDYLCQGTVRAMLRTIFHHPDAAIISMLYTSAGYQDEGGFGMDYYLQKVSFNNTYITASIYRTEYLETAVVPEKFAHSFLPQVALQMEVLREHPAFATFAFRYLQPSSGEAVQVTAEERAENGNRLGLLNFGKVFIQEYFDVLQYYVGKGLAETSLHMEMKQVLENLLLPRCKAIRQRNTLYHTGEVLRYYDAYYSDEPYYKEGRRLLEPIVEADNLYKDLMDDKGE